LFFTLHALFPSSSSSSTFFSSSCSSSSSFSSFIYCFFSFSSTHSSSVIIGADGVNSLVREVIFKGKNFSEFVDPSPYKFLLVNEKEDDSREKENKGGETVGDDGSEGEREEESGEKKKEKGKGVNDSEEEEKDLFSLRLSLFTRRNVGNILVLPFTDGALSLSFLPHPSLRIFFCAFGCLLLFLPPL